jgi:hypothetical protein
MIRLTDVQLREVQQAAQMVPYDLRQAFLERLALELRQGFRRWTCPVPSPARSPGMLDVWRRKFEILDGGRCRYNVKQCSTSSTPGRFVRGYLVGS